MNDMEKALEIQELMDKRIDLLCKIECAHGTLDERVHRHSLRLLLAQIEKLRK